MAKLVIGSSKQNGVPAIVKEVTIQPDLGTKTITTNGTYNASTDNLDGYSAVTVNVPTVVEPYLELEVYNGTLRHSRATSRVLSFVGVQTISEPYILANAYAGNSSVTGTVSMPDLTTISGESAFFQAFYGSGITGISAPNLTTVTGSSVFDRGFAGSMVSTIYLPNLTSVSGTSAFYSAFMMSKVEIADFPKLQIISGGSAFYHAFYSCDYLTSASFSALEYLTGPKALETAFAGASNITDIYFNALSSSSFGSYMNQFHNMLQYVTGCTVHFPSNLQSVIGSWDDVQAGFGGTNTTVLFDLTQTE